MDHADDWLNSSLTLCELTVVSQTSTDSSKMPRVAVFDVQSCPPPTYNPTSILSSLGLYTHTLAEALKRDHADSEGSIGLVQGQGSSVAAAVHNFAQALVIDIINSATYHSVGNMECEQIMSSICYTEENHSSDPKVNVSGIDGQECNSSNYTDEEKLAEDLASLIIRMALKELNKCSGLKASVLSSSPGTWQSQSCEERTLSGCGRTQEAFVEDMDTYWDNESTFEPASSRPRGRGSSSICRSLLSQTSLASNQSLDYPEAPPSTPLVPGVTQSRASFCRKLKGGLAKEFLPSPPPPTPNRNPNPSHRLLKGYNEMAEDTAEFVNHLMRSLSLECSEDVDVDNVSDGLPSKRSWTDWSVLSDYADQLSADIIEYVTTSDEAGDDFVERLMWSLSECIEDTLVEAKENHGGPLSKICNDSALNDFAHRLATDIIRCGMTSYLSLTDPNKTGEAFKQSLHSVAECWVEEILEASYREMIDRVRAKMDTLARPNPHGAKSEMFTSPDAGVEASALSQTHRPTSVVQSLQRTRSKDDPGTGKLKELAEALLATACIQALTELRSAVLHSGSGPVGPDPSDHTSGSQRSFLQPFERMQTSLSSGDYGQAAGALQANDVDRAVDRYAEEFALEVIDGSLTLASKYLLGSGKTCSRWCNEEGSWHVEEGKKQRHHGPMVRALLGSQMCRSTNELKGALLWAAASQLGTQTLILVVPDSQLQATFVAVAHQTHLLGWTVGDLMTSLLQHCTHLSQVPSRGSPLNDVYPLTHLQELIGVSR